MSTPPLNIVRIPDVEKYLPLKKATFYKWKAEGMHPEIFIKIGGALFVDIDAFWKMVKDTNKRR